MIHSIEKYRNEVKRITILQCMQNVMEYCNFTAEQAAEAVGIIPDERDYYIQTVKGVEIDMENMRAIFEDHPILSELPEDQQKAVEWAKKEQKRILSKK